MTHLQVIIGLGLTGLSCARYLAEKNQPFAINDTRSHPPLLAEFQREFPDVPISLGQLDKDLLDKASRLIMSPGVALQQPAIVQQMRRGVPVIGDIELFVQETKVPIIAITGTNAKSTVTSLVGAMAATAGVRVQVGGNLGPPAMDLLRHPETELFVLELSSFQLETVHSLAPRVATVLNVTPDHMDRYATLQEYMQAKQHVYTNCETAICNRDDPLTECGDRFKKQKIHFTLNVPRANEFGLVEKNADYYLAYEDEILLPVRELPIVGRHYQANALAALALGQGFGLAMAPMLETLRTFKGLPHRCQLVRFCHGIYWYNDSKGTNVGATLAAIEGLGHGMQGKLILIAGGIGKNADFTPLVSPIANYARAVVLIGEAATLLAKTLGDRVAVHFAHSMEEAVVTAARIAQQGDSVLLSPACASLDMFKNFEHRGQVFAEIVLNLP